MGKEINLLPKKNIGLLQQERTILILRISAFASVVIVASVTIGMFFLGRTYSVDVINQEQESIATKLRILQPKIQKEIALVNRINQIQEILKKRSLIVTKATTLQNLIPSDVSIDIFSITGNRFNLSLSSSSLSSLTTCLDGFTAALKKKTIFSTVTVQNVGLDIKAAAYKANITGILL
jgi:Tfp pilus assembly protein PilN